MEQTETLKIFDKDQNQLGVATREEVHKIGYWHETFHCWFVSREDHKDYLYLQLRSHLKKDYPNLFDITAAGHILANETVFDGVREIKEEIGINVPYSELIPLGMIHYSVKKENFIDKELAHTFLYQFNQTFDQFILQKEEVSGIVKIEFNDFYELWLGEKEAIRLTGFFIDKDGNRESIDGFFGKGKFVPHGISFYKSVLNLIKKELTDN